VTDAIAQNKAPWPPESERERLRRYQRNALLYLGRHAEVFTSRDYGWRYSYDHNRNYVGVNLCGALTDVLAWRLFGEGIQIRAPQGETEAQRFLDDLYHDCDLDALLLSAAVNASYAGDAWLKLRYDAEEGRIAVELVSPELVFPEFAPLNARRMSAVAVAQVLKHEKHAYLWQERHEMREGESWITNGLYRLSGDERSGYRFDARDDRVPLAAHPATAELPEEQPTGVPGLLLIHIPNRQIAEEPFWGVSDYEGLLEIQGELNNRRTQRAEVLDKHVDPYMWGPPLDAQGEIHLREHKYFEADPGTGPPVGMLTWDAQLGAAVEEIRDLTEQFATVAGIEPGALMTPQGGAPQSGRAIRLSQFKMAGKVMGKQMMWGPALRRLIALATQLANAPGVRLERKPPILSPRQISLIWSDGLPADDREDAEIAALRVQAGLDSRKAAMQKLLGLSDEDAESRWQEMMAEEQAAAAPAPGDLTANIAMVTAGE
jgi:hypothetical protein